ncbi:glycosyltransferase [Stutzerimonas xanthomarina]|uniref:glycosyltransferase n=1 Tax=Stutzerimonas xanthomarina TaxID=271420 RepID=UPI0029A99CA8|nr:glycosyltransferase [Stutzerimonas xanthomarina]MDX2352681.1 glycosyltransferase [Stutzerimonas xanthomarina]
MRIVIDLQAAQSAASANRGVGRYSLSLALAMARNRGEHEVLVALNALFPETIEPIREAFAGLLPPDNIRVWNVVGPVSELNSEADWPRKSAEIGREAFLSSLRPDVVHVSSLFEGLIDDAVTSVGVLSHNIPTAVTLYDLIPYIHRKPYLENPEVERWYLDKLEQLRRADLWLAISESSAREGVEYLGLPAHRAINISTDADVHFRPLDISAEAEELVRTKHGLSRPFVMYTGGIDPRKNIEGLIRAFATLPDKTRAAYQLAIVCSIQPETRHMLEELASQHGLRKDELVITGFVSEVDLVTLYNLCALFVFPSWHEGFGLPALEAMRCGAPVIAANTSSLPEVVGWERALFDPHSDESIASAIQRSLTDQDFKGELIRHGALQSRKFSWDETARRAIAAMECLHAEHKEALGLRGEQHPRPRLAYISPLPPEKSGIADYSAELLPELSRLYEIDVIVVQSDVSDSWVLNNCPVRSVRWFLEHADQYDRVLYHFGNSPFHQHMFELLKVVPGVVVLHDFFLSGVVSYRDALKVAPDAWASELYNSHGYAALLDRFHAIGPQATDWKYPCSLSVIQDSLGIIVHSSHSLQLASKWYGGDSFDWAVIPLMRGPRVEERQTREALGFDSEDFLVCTFGLLGPTKLNHRLLQAWIKSGLAHEKRCRLIFVGENHHGDYGQELLSIIKRERLGDSVHITGWTDMEVFRQYLAAANVGVQLRTRSRGETSAAVLDCMNYGLATIVNANGGMVDLDAEAVWMLPDHFSDEQLVDALKTLWGDEQLCKRMGAKARDIILRDHDPRVCAGKYHEAIERFYRYSASDISALPSALVSIGADDDALIRFSDAVVQGFPSRNRTRRLLVDISTLVHCDSKSGIQRVVRSILQEWISNPPSGLRVEPVYATVEVQGYRYARKFTLGFIDCPIDSLDDDWVDFDVGDVFVGLDLQHHVVVAQQASFQKMRQLGMKVKFVVYDLLPILLPHAFITGAAQMHDAWLRAVLGSGDAICISKAVADELNAWLQEHLPARREKVNIDWFHLGADVENSRPSKGLTAGSSSVLSSIRKKTSFLMVGTIEPRKGYSQVVEAFERLWNDGCEANLVLVGKQGWMVDALAERLRNHPEKDRRLFWLEAISDEYLEKVYAASTCLIAASYGEGFGLPLIEAAQYNIPIIARDIPVFREVACDHAYYFNASEPEQLATAIIQWLDSYGAQTHPSSEHMPWLTWKESAARLMQIALA